MHARPSFYADFTNDYGYLDPRIAYVRASTGTYCDRNGIIRTRSLNNPRFGFSPSTGYPLGLHTETTTSNFAVNSEDFTLWSASAVTVTTNATAAPDGNATADLVTANAALPAVAQSFTFNAGFGLYLSVFAKKGAANFLYMNFTDGGNVPTAWFDLNLGTVSSHSGGGGTCTYSNALIEPWPNGWYRCMLSVGTSTITSIQVGFHPSSADAITGQSGDAIYLWGAMLTQLSVPSGAIYGKFPSYVPTAGTAATRSSENCTIALPDPTWFDPNQGTFFIDFSIPVGGGANVSTLFGSGNTVNDVISIYYGLRNDFSPTNTIFGSISAGGVQRAVASDNGAIVAYETSVRVALGYKQGDVLNLCINGRAVQQSAAVPAAWPAAPVRLTVGGQPWQPSGNSGCDIRRIAYFPRKLTNAQLQDLTL